MAAMSIKLMLYNESAFRNKSGVFRIVCNTIASDRAARTIVGETQKSVKLPEPDLYC